jgi:hypothetical protein
VFFSTRSIHHPLAIAFLCAAIAGGCGGDPKEPRVVSSGFLGDYSQLAPGREGQAHLIYINPEADFSLYDKMVIEPVALWDREQSAPIATPSRDQRRLAEQLQRALATQLGHGFQLVDEAEPGTLSLRMAITSAGDTQVGIEVELVDVMSRTRLAAAVDDRDVVVTVGADATDPLGAAFDDWAALIRMRLVALRNFDAAQKELDQAVGP